MPARKTASKTTERTASKTTEKTAAKGSNTPPGKAPKTTPRPSAKPEPEPLSAVDPALIERFRRLALTLPGTEEGMHHGAADFRVGGRIFATLAFAARGLGNLMLTPELQQAFLAEAQDWFLAAPGGWGRMGITSIRLDAPEDVTAGALIAAHRLKQAAQGTRRKAVRLIG